MAYSGAMALTNHQPQPGTILLILLLISFPVICIFRLLGGAKSKDARSLCVSFLFQGLKMSLSGPAIQPTFSVMVVVVLSAKWAISIALITKQNVSKETPLLRYSFIKSICREVELVPNER